MADNIAKLNVLISATATPMDPGIDGAVKKVQDLKGAVTSTMGAAFAPVGSLASAAGTVLSGQIGKGVNQALESFKGIPPVVQMGVDALGMIPGPVGMIAQGVGKLVLPALVAAKDVTLGWAQAFVEMGERGMARMREASRMAKQFGMSTTAATGLQLLAQQTGQDSGDLARGFFGLNRGIANARDGSLEAELAFRRMGVSMEMLQSRDTGAVLEQLRRFREMTADAQMADRALSQAIGGRSARALIPILNEQGDAMGEATERAVRFGTAFTDAEGAMVRGANRARQHMAADFNALFQGLENRAGVALAPVWEGIAKGADRLIDMAAPAFEGLRTGIDGIGSGLKSVMDGFNRGLERWEPHLDRVFHVFQEIGSIIGLILTGSDGAAADWGIIGEAVAFEVVSGLQRAAGFALDIADAGVQIWQAFRKSVEAIDNVINGLRVAYNVARRNAVAVDPTRVGNQRGVVDAHLPPEFTAAPSNMAAGLRDLADVEERIRDARAALNGPMRSREEIAAERNFRLFQRTAQAQLEQQAARRRAMEQGAAAPQITAAMLHQALGDSAAAPPAPPALTAGQARTIDAINASTRQTADPAERMADNVERQLQVQVDQRELFRRVLQILERRGIDVAEVDFGAGG